MSGYAVIIACCDENLIKIHHYCYNIDIQDILLKIMETSDKITKKRSNDKTLKSNIW